MKLPDFNEYDPFNQLREKMGAESLGHFELFDPKYHLTGFERSELDSMGLNIPKVSLMQLLDFTLVYKNSRVILLLDNVYHLSFCEQMAVPDECHVLTSVAGLHSHIHVCEHCLQRLQYRGYDSSKARKEAYSRQVLERFSLLEYWRQFPKYPISENRDMRKSLIN